MKTPAPAAGPAPATTVLLDGCVAAATAAARHAVANRHRRRATIAVAKHDVKLELDVECQRVAEQVIRERFPGHAILGEEQTGAAPASTAPAADSTPTWIIDPIDGTVNFSHGMRQWCSSVAVRQAGAVLAGAVVAPDLDECYTAAADQPARCNGLDIRVSDVDRLADAIVRTSLDKATDGIPYRYFLAIAERARKTRVMGAAALDLCHVACGMADAYFESVIYIWDVAAAGLVVRRAGGCARELGAGPGGRLIYAATNGRLQQELETLLGLP